MLQQYKEHLTGNLQKAIELEHSTIPPYLTAMFTINQDSNAFAYQTIRSVVMEEMLHMALACNIMNAIGGEPAIDQPEFIPEYPTELDFAGRKFDVGIIKFSPQSIETFINIEQPAEEKIAEKGLMAIRLPHPIVLEQNTIGEFYAAIKEQLIALVDEYGEAEVFSGDPSRQLAPENYYGSGGEIIKVVDLETALFAMDIIAEQGEGAEMSIFDGDNTNFGQEEEVAHYFRFKEIQLGRSYVQGDVPNRPPSGPAVDVNFDLALNMMNNPKAEHFKPGSTAREKAEEFNQIYSHFLRVLHLSFNGMPGLMMKAVGMMYQLKYVADALLHIPVEGSLDLPKGTHSKATSGKVAGPPFQYIEPEARKEFEWVIEEAKKDMNKSICT